MTLEEEKSDKTLNSYLTAKIIELENEIKVKRQKLDKITMHNVLDLIVNLLQISHR
jgi:hypothetical protein